MVVLEESESSQELKGDCCASDKRSCGKEADDNIIVASPHGSKDGEAITPSRRRCLAYFDRNEIQVNKKRPIGEGYHGIVYEITGFRLRKDVSKDTPEEQEARQKCLNQLQHPNGQARYVMKHLNPRLLQAAGQSISRIQTAALDLVAEANFMKQLDHPNILKIQGLAHGSTPFQGGRYDSFFFITERLGETLAQRIQRWKRQAPTIAHKCHLGLQLAQALSYLHDQGLIFRDLKPSNVGFDAENPDQLKLFDFGLCRQLPSSGLESEVYQMSGGVGTRRYCAPEVCQHQSYNQKADVWAFAMVFLEMLTLAKPFADFSKEDHHKFVCELGGTPNLRAYQLPTNLQSLLRNAWARQVSRRWSMAQVCEEMQWIMDEEQLTLSSDSSPADSNLICPLDRRRSMDHRKDGMVNLEEECCSGSSSVNYLSARA